MEAMNTTTDSQSTDPLDGPRPLLDLSPVGLDDLMPLTGAEADIAANWRALRYCRTCFTRRLGRGTAP